jgi:hypothetical protein
MIALLPAALALLAVPATAAGKSYCVTPATGCDVNGIAAIQTALNDAQGDSTGSDLVQLGATSYNQTGLTYSGVIPLALQGAGAAQTAIAPAAGGTIFRNNSTQPVSIQGITFTLPSGTDSTGIQGFSGPIAVSHVVVNGAPSTAHGIQVDKGGTVTNSTVTMPTPASGVSDGIDVTGPGDVTLADDTVTARLAVQVSSRTSGTVGAHRLRLATANNNGAGFILVEPGSATIDDSLVSVGTNASGVFVSGGVGGSATLTARHVTVMGDGGATESAFTTYGSSGGGSGALNVFDSIARNTTNSVFISSTGGVSATVSGDYNDFPGATTSGSNPPHVVMSGTGASFTAGPHNIDADPLFVSASNFHLLVGSPAANRDPTAQQAGESSTDLDGNPRFATGTGRDMGAYQQQPPTATASASPASQTTGAPLTFTGSGSDPTSGSTLTYSWAFDDGASASGASVTHAFAMPGPHSGTLTVTDTAGRTGTASATVTVTAVIVPPLPPLPDLEGFALTNRTFAVGGSSTPIGGALTATVKRGTRFKFRINTAAAVVLSFQRALPGRRAGRSCLPPRRRPRGHHDKPCTRYVGMGHINRSVSGAGSYSIAFSGHVSGSAVLPVGKYHAILGATNASGAATPRTTSFTIVAVPKKHKRGH